MTNDPKKQQQEQFFIQMKTFLTILEKLMFQHLHGKNMKVVKKSARFTSDFLTNLERLVQLTVNHIARIKSLNFTERSVDDLSGSKPTLSKFSESIIKSGKCQIFRECNYYIVIQTFIESKKLIDIRV